MWGWCRPWNFGSYLIFSLYTFFKLLFPHQSTALQRRQRIAPVSMDPEWGNQFSRNVGHYFQYFLFPLFTLSLKIHVPWKNWSLEISKSKFWKRILLCSLSLHAVSVPEGTALKKKPICYQNTHSILKSPFAPSYFIKGEKASHFWVYVLQKELGLNRVSWSVF